jgi:hypothetical protein
MCQCTFPPQPMLWRQAEGAFVCQNPACGRRTEGGTPRAKIIERSGRLGPCGR